MTNHVNWLELAAGSLEPSILGHWYLKMRETIPQQHTVEINQR